MEFKTSKTFEVWAKEKATPRWIVAAARQHAFGGVVGHEITEEEFEEAIASALRVRVGV